MHPLEFDLGRIYGVGCVNLVDSHTAEIQMLIVTSIVGKRGRLQK